MTAGCWRRTDRRSQLDPRAQARLAPGEVVDHKRLDGVFAWIVASGASVTPLGQAFVAGGRAGL
jgi:hypothetical protein